MPVTIHAAGTVPETARLTHTHLRRGRGGPRHPRGIQARGGVLEQIVGVRVPSARTGLRNTVRPSPPQRCETDDVVFSPLQVHISAENFAAETTQFDDGYKPPFLSPRRSYFPRTHAQCRICRCYRLAPPDL